ncbi:MAG: iron-containing alcohol dehydrogenase [Spirochaetes bacterium]|nr:MAG: iron-containing alcohol dehydrogenase [Spirochaetota bacterium]
MATAIKSITVPDFYIPTEVYLKQDVVSELGGIVSAIGSRALIITTPRDLQKFSEALDRVSHSLHGSEVSLIVYDDLVDSPNTEYVDSATYFAKKSHCDVILGFGGIDSINVAKAVSLLATNFLFCDDLFENPHVNAPLPLVTIPTQPVFGFEILPQLYINEIKNHFKQVYAHRYLYPRATVIDPSFSTVIDDESTAYASISALSLATESVISKTTNQMVNTYALKAIDLTFKFLPLAYREPANITARANLAMASVMSGIAFTVCNLSVSMAIALALSSRTDVTVPQAMALLLPHVMEYNLTSSPGKYVQMSKVMDEDVREITVIEAAIKAVEGVRKLEIDTDIPQRLSHFDLPKTEFSRIAEIALSYPFLENAPRPLSRDEIETILIAAY